MEDIYLTRNLKEYYMVDFDSNVLTSSDEFWALDNGLKDLLIQINKNIHVQTLYSKKRQFGGMLDMLGSYIQIAYTGDVELKIFREIIPYFLVCYNTKDQSKFNYMFLPPVVSSDDNLNELDLGCLTDINYFNINSIRFELESDDKEIHDKFWVDLGTKLADLKP